MQIVHPYSRFFYKWKKEATTFFIKIIIASGDISPVFRPPL